MNTLTVNGVEYHYKETFDTNLTTQYENDRWNTWHILREFISNALDSVSGDPSRVTLRKGNGCVLITDDGQGYPIVYAKRVGATSKKETTSTIGQFGEGTKLAVLTCLRNGLSVKLASQDWLIVPKIVAAEENIQVLVFDIFIAGQAVPGSTVSIDLTPEIEELIDSREQYFLHFGAINPLFGDIYAGIYPKPGQAKLYIKGVYIKDIEALFSYALSVEDLNRDRDLIDDDILCRGIRDLWNTVDDPELISTYYKESERAGIGGTNSPCKEFNYSVYPKDDYRDSWVYAFYCTFGDKAVVYTNDLAAQEALLLGFNPVRLEYYGRNVAEYIGIRKDVDVCRDDYEFTWADKLSKAEEDRLTFFRQIADMVGMACPDTIRIFEAYAKSEYLVGQYNRTKDEIYIKRERLSGNLILALETFIHELTHRETGADDGDRSFANGLSTLAAKVVLEFTAKVGLPIILPLTNRGFQLPRTFSYSAENLLSSIATLGSEIIIKTCGHTLRAMTPGINLRPYSTERAVTFYKGYFYLNVPAAIRDMLPSEVFFSATMDSVQIS